jgi:hypothetical protein
MKTLLVPEVAERGRSDLPFLKLGSKIAPSRRVAGGGHKYPWQSSLILIAVSIQRSKLCPIQLNDSDVIRLCSAKQILIEVMISA